MSIPSREFVGMQASVAHEVHGDRRSDGHRAGPGRSLLFLLLGVKEAEGGYLWNFRQRFHFLVTGKPLAVGLVALYFLLFVSANLQFSLFSPFATVDEQLAYYTVARNFERYGFLNSLFLQDFSTSSNPLDHPFVYNHMPSGPEVFIALISKGFGSNYRLIRFVFAVIFLIGVTYYFKFARILLEGLGLRGEGYAFAFISPVMFIHAIDHPLYSTFPLFAFFPLVSLQSHYKTGRRLPLCLALGVIFLGSVYLSYQHLLMIFVCWAALYLFQLVRFDRRDLVAFFGAGVLGILLHLGQNFVYLGPSVFFRELWFTLSNRISGFPTAEELKDFYQSSNLVLHGTHQLSLRGIGRALIGTLALPAGFLLMILAVLVLGKKLLTDAIFDASKGFFLIPKQTNSRSALDAVLAVGALGIWVVSTVTVPLLVFPAYSSDYGLQRVNEFFLGLGAIAILAYAVQEIWRNPPQLPLEAGRKSLLNACVWAVMVLIVVGIVYRVGVMQRDRLKTVVIGASEQNPFASLAEISNRFKGSVVMTNVYPATVSFFTDEASFGGCELSVFLPDGTVDPSGCHAAWIRGYGRNPEVAPTHYVLFRGLFTGFTKCRGGECMNALYERVARNHDVVFENDLYTVFELRGRKHG